MNRLFHTLVVCGAGLTLAHCGGKSRTDVDGDTDDSGGSAGSGYSSGGTAAGSATGGVSAVGGNASAVGGSTSPGGRGGAAGSVGAGGLSTGGVAGTSAMAGAGGNGAGGLPLLGTSERWTCYDEGCFGYISVPGGCVADPDRPASADECGAGEIFACMSALFDDGIEVRVNCECVPEPPDGCPCPSSVSCTAVPQMTREECSNGESVCLCATTCILK